MSRAGPGYVRGAQQPEMQGSVRGTGTCDMSMDWGTPSTTRTKTTNQISK